MAEPGLKALRSEESGALSLHYSVRMILPPSFTQPGVLFLGKPSPHGRVPQGPAQRLEGVS